MFFILSIGLYTSRVVLNTLGIVDFGIYNVVGGIVSMFTFINGAMSGATQRYLNFELGLGEVKKLNEVFCTSINIHALISLIILLLAETIGLWFVNTQMKIPSNRINAAIWVYQLSIFTCIINIMSVPYNSLIIAHEKMNAFAYISVIEVSLKLIIVYLLSLSKSDKLIFYAILIFIVQMSIRFIYSIYCKKRFSECHYRLFFDKPLFKDMTAFASWTLLGNIAYVGYTQGLNILLNIFGGPTVNAARGIAVQVQSAVVGFCANFQTALNPQITKSYAQDRLRDMYALIYASSKFSVYLLFLLTLPIIIETDQVLHIWLKIVPEHTIVFVRLIMCSIMIDAIANPIIHSAEATGKIRNYQIVVSSILLCILPVSYLFLKLGFPVESVFFVHLFIVIIAQLARLIMIRKMIGISLKLYIKNVIFKIIPVLILSPIVPVTIFNLFSNNLITLIVVFIASIGSVLIFSYVTGLSKQEKKFIKETILHAIKK